MPQELKIAMLGPTGVGKTSLLTAMYHQFDSTIGQTGLQLTPDPERSAILQERLGELMSLLDDFEAQGGIPGTDQPRSFKFELGERGRQPSLQLNFQDFPGAYLDSQASHEQREYVDNLLKDCVAVLIAIDAPAMMENGGKWHDTINRPKQIANYFQRNYQEIKLPRLVILAPVRCEKYLQDNGSTRNLLKQIRYQYSTLLDLFKSEALSPYIVTVVTPVQTVGNVVFSHITVDNGTPHFHFRKTSHEAKYDPRDSDQPLRYLLRFVLKLHLEDRNWGPFNWIRQLLSLDEHLKQAARQSANGCQLTGGFAVLQGYQWLNIK